MKLLSIAILFALLLLNPQKIFATTIFEDTFEVTGGGGDANYQYDSGTRQSGTAANLSYGWWFSTNIAIGYVTNAGPTAGLLFLPEGASGNGLGGSIAPNYNFTDSGDFSIEVEFHQTGLNDWTALNFGKNGLLDNLWDDPGMGFMFYPNGTYIIYDHWHDNHPTGTFTFAELAYTSNPVLKVKITVSQPGGFPPTGDAKIALFINDIPYPTVTKYDSGLGWNVNKYIHTYKGGFSNNYINIGANVDVGIDNLKVTTSTTKTFENTIWTNATEAGISNSKLYTHAINFNRATDVSVNGVIFEGSPTNNIAGKNWVLRNDANLEQIAQNIAVWGYAPNVTPECLPLLTNCLYDAWTCGGVALSGLDPTLKYKISLYNTGFEAGGTVDAPRPSFFATSDGAVIKSVNQNPYGRNNASVTTYEYMPSAEGKFAFSTATATASNWIWYAFSNEVTPPYSPASVSASQGSFSDRVRVAWTSVDGAQFYSVFRSDNNIFSSASEIQSGISTNSFDDLSVAAGQYYYYWVKSVNTGGVSSATGPALGYTSSASKPNQPSNISPTSFDVVTAPALLTASAFSDPEGFDFEASQWEVSQYDDFSFSYFKSGETIDRNFFTAPANIIREGTNYWRVKYENEFSTWSDWSDGTSFIYVPATNGPMTFFDTFNVSGSGDANFNYDTSNRQYGNAAPLTYKTEGTTEVGAASANPYWLTLGQNSGVSPNHSFLETPSFKVEFDIKPHNLDGSADWCSISLGKEDQDSLSPSSDSGFGNLFYANGTFQTYSGNTLIGDVTGLPVGESLHVVISAKSKDFEYEPTTLAVFVNDLPMVVDSTTLPVVGMTFYDYVRNDGFFEENFISFFNNNENSSSSTTIDNFIVKPAEDVVTAYHWTGDADSFIDADYDYTHKINIDGDDLTINGVTFEGTGPQTTVIANGDPIITKSDWNFTASGSVFGFEPPVMESNFVSGTSHDLAETFAWAHGSFGINLSGLTAYSSNSLFVYAIGWEDIGAGREGRFASSYGGAITNIDQDLFNKGGGLIIQYDYIASKDGKFSLAISPTKRILGDAPTFHVSAFANIETGVPEGSLIFTFLFSFVSFYVSRKKFNRNLY